MGEDDDEEERWGPLQEKRGVSGVQHYTDYRARSGGYSFTSIPNSQTTLEERKINQQIV